MSSIKRVTGTVLAGALTAGLAVSSALAKTPEQNPERKAAIERIYRQYKAAAFSDGADQSWTAWQARDDDRVLVDVREPEERAVSTIPGAIPKDVFEANKDAYRDKAIGVYCTIGYRSGVYSRELEEEGWNTVNLQGGIVAWTHEVGEDLTGPEGKTHAVHVYGGTWDLAHNDYEATW